jgi:hypothetical protein
LYDEGEDAKQEEDEGVGVGVLSRSAGVFFKVDEYGEHFGEEDAEGGEDEAVDHADEYSKGEEQFAVTAVAEEAGENIIFVFFNQFLLLFLLFFLFGQRGCCLSDGIFRCWLCFCFLLLDLVGDYLLQGNLFVAFGFD